MACHVAATLEGEEGCEMSRGRPVKRMVANARLIHTLAPWRGRLEEYLDQAPDAWGAIGYGVHRAAYPHRTLHAPPVRRPAP